MVILLIIATMVLATSNWAMASRPRIIKYYVQQESEIGMIPALAVSAVERASGNASGQNANLGVGSGAGVGVSVVYEYPMTKNSSAASPVVGFIRGTSVVVNSSAAGTLFFMNNVIHFSSGKWAGSTISQQGEAMLTRSPWELAVVGGTGDFRHAFGYNVGFLVATSRTPHNTTRITTRYHAHLSYVKTT